MLKLGIFGASGRVGKLLIEEIAQNTDLEVSVVYARDNLESLHAQGLYVAKDIKEFLQSCECVIDFSSAAGSLELIKIALENNLARPIVIGSTGFSQDDFARIKKASQILPILQASNMSRGVSVLNKLSSLTARALKESDIEIVEIHHHHKKDAPSGTALTLAQTCAQARGLDIDKVRISGRDGNIGARSKDEIGVMSLRGGDVVGRHTVGFYLDGEYLELTHNATSRATFAKGAIAAARWLVNQKAGLYGIEDFLCLDS
ncbi:4-hydroxy-tetrahydrodipicolinate reductase [Helicobacter sp. MIT 00-7814]|uniref:4-hydroxy-tetrahydrodipicolinate reductase n=1 Tax=unclassified Helicobacter TaxID=2593540 RepID=UPI000E1F85DB|nr:MULTISPECIES: 4-hydroxy-tetrahydrodipicolinate reductase [unclassified Helicobacter]RDU52815.1 4-hydroxy-tetrahydrodipicolinate reductase [Helicobacter sp. MIT 99-10781]RDU53248.1 4-hydroxy-tetrahydrodipicolinate reductase [Helicobacter sp. MIT 00-7814]